MQTRPSLCQARIAGANVRHCFGNMNHAVVTRSSKSNCGWYWCVDGANHARGARVRLSMSPRGFLRRVQRAHNSYLDTHVSCRRLDERSVQSFGSRMLRVSRLAWKETANVERDAHWSMAGEESLERTISPRSPPHASNFSDDLNLFGRVFLFSRFLFACCLI
jgi:hypothetical protein